MAKRPPVYRPVKRYKSRSHRWGKVEIVEVRRLQHTLQCPGDSSCGEVSCLQKQDPHEYRVVEIHRKGVDPKRWVRWYPNPGYKRKNGNHWCRKYGRHPMPE